MGEIRQGSRYWWARAQIDRAHRRIYWMRSSLAAGVSVWIACLNQVSGIPWKAVASEIESQESSMTVLSWGIFAGGLLFVIVVLVAARIAYLRHKAKLRLRRDFENALRVEREHGDVVKAEIQQPSLIKVQDQV